MERYCCILSHLRLLTILTIEKVEAWRKNLVQVELRGRGDSSFKQDPLVFLHEGNSILKTIYRDCFFLNTSVLRKFIQFSKGFDPLMMSPLRKIQNNSSTRMKNYDSVLKLFEVGPTMKSRLQISEIALMEEQVLIEENFERELESLEEANLEENYLLSRRMEEGSHELEDRKLGKSALLDSFKRPSASRRLNLHS